MQARTGRRPVDDAERHRPGHIPRRRAIHRPAAEGVARDAFAGAGRPLSDFGTELEQFIVVVATVLTLILVLVTLVPWLSRYVPWRWERLRRMRAGHRTSGRHDRLARAELASVGLRG